MYVPVGIVLLPPYRDNTVEDTLDYSKEEVETINFGEEE